MTTTIYSVTDLPNRPAVYAMYGGRGLGLYVAYVGVADSLKHRIAQHLIRKDSSVTTGVSAAMLNSSNVTELKWWEHVRFQVRIVLEAAELVAFDVLNPALRSRGATKQKSMQLYQDTVFREEMKSLFTGTLSGHLVLRDLSYALDMIDALEKRVAELERRLGKGD